MLSNSLIDTIIGPAGMYMILLLVVADNVQYFTLIVHWNVRIANITIFAIFIYVHIVLT